MASSRRTGTNEAGWNGASWVVGTPNQYGTGKEYTSLVTWEADTDVDVSAAGAAVSPVIEVYGNSYSGSAQIVKLQGATTDSTHFRIIRPASGNFLNTGAISTKHFSSTYSTTGALLALQESYSQVQDLVVTGTINSTSLRWALYNEGANAAFVGCVVIDFSNSGGGGASGFGLYYSGSGVKVLAINCIAHNCTTDGFYLQYSSASNPICYNCTSTGNGAYGFNGNNSTYCILKNCGATGNGTADIEDGTFAETTDSESAPTFAAGTDNFHLASNDTTWHDQGTDLSADANYAFDDDIDRVTRVTWDIGADEYVAAAGSAIASIMTNLRRFRTV